jgi:prolyl oligopeptidase
LPDVLVKTPFSEADPVTEVIHGIPVTDPYRWLEDQDSSRTRQWLTDQTSFAREYLDAIPGRDRIRSRIREFLEIETYDSLLIAGHDYFFRKRLPDQEQPCIYMREGPEGKDRLLVDPSDRGIGKYAAVKPLAVSPDGKILIYEVKEGGERTSCLELLDIQTRNRLPDELPRGYLRAFAFAPDSQSFYYAQDPIDQTRPFHRAIYQHKLGTPVEEDLSVFDAGEANSVRLALTAGPKYLLVLVYRFLERRLLDCYLQPFESGAPAKRIVDGIDYLFAPQFVDDRIFVQTSHKAPNFRIAELHLHSDGGHDFVDVVPARDAMILSWIVLRQHIVVSYLEGTSFKFRIFDLFGKKVGEVPLKGGETARLITGDLQRDEILFECESFFDSPAICRYSLVSKVRTAWTNSAISLDTSLYTHRQVWYRSGDGTNIPMYLVGRNDVLERKCNPAILTSYGGFRHVMTPQFSVFVSFLMEKGCVFALPSIRGGGEFGAGWHAAARRHNRQRAFDDFLSAAESLIDTGTAAPSRIAIFGGSNSGLLVGAAMTQAPGLFRAVLFNAPLLDMVRYHLFNGADKWKEEFGTADDPEDFVVLWSYSPYHRVTDNTAYPAVMMISGDSDQNCNPLHARKTVARLQSANVSSYPIILDYSPYRGHSPVLPLSTRIDALTDRMAFLCDQLGLTV